MNRCSEFDAITAYKKDNLKITDLYIKTMETNCYPPLPHQVNFPVLCTHHLLIPGVVNAI